MFKIILSILFIIGSILPCLLKPSYDHSTQNGIGECNILFLAFTNHFILFSLLLLSIFLFFYYRKSIFKKTSYSVFCRLFFLSLITVLFLNLTNLSNYNLLIPVSTLVLTSLFCLSRILGRISSASILTFILFIALTTNIFAHLGIQITDQIMMEIIEASWSDARHFLSLSNCLLLILFFAISATISFCYLWVSRGQKKSTLFSFGVFLLTISCIQSSCIDIFPQKEYLYKWPMGSTYAFFAHIKHAINLSNKTESLFHNVPPKEEIQATSKTADRDSGVICILHIGESLRADRLSLNGWKNNTSPWLQEQDLINFPHCISSAWTTDIALIPMLTNSRRAHTDISDIQNIPTSGSIMDYFSTIGFHTTALWAQSYEKSTRTFLIDKEVEFFSRAAEKKMLRFTESHKLIPIILDSINNQQDESQFIIINNYGSHMPFSEYDHKNPPFTPVKELNPPLDLPSLHPEMEIYYNNAYDNTVHWTDDFIKNILEPLKGKPYVYVYMSDHGELLGDTGDWLRGAINFENYFIDSNACKVPFIVIASPEFETLNPRFHENLNQLRLHQQMLIGHEHLFHTLLGLFDIKTKDYDSSLDLCSPNVKPYTGPQPKLEESDKQTE